MITLSRQTDVVLVVLWTFFCLHSLSQQLQEPKTTVDNKIKVKDNQKESYLDTFFNAYWRDNLDLSSEKEFLILLESLKIDSKIFFEKIKQQSIKDDLKKLTNDAFEKEVFGAPTFIVNNKIFWGQDRLEYALEELN